MVTYKSFFQPHGQINSLEDMGYKLPGINRRPAIHDMHAMFHDKVATVTWRACSNSTGNSFGRGIHIHKCSSLRIWTPCPLHETYRVIAERKDASITPVLPTSSEVNVDNECGFCASVAIESRCNVECDFEWYRFITFRAQLGNCIHDIPTAFYEGTATTTTKVYITNISSTDADITEISNSETNTERISRLAKGILARHRSTRSGPCHICNNINTAAKFWHASPITSPWPGIAADVSLCQRCYQVYYRAVKRGVAPIFADVHYDSAYGRPPDTQAHSSAGTRPPREITAPHHPNHDLT